jgi:hypothetical protein
VATRNGYNMAYIHILFIYLLFIIFIYLLYLFIVFTYGMQIIGTYLHILHQQKMHGN